jgi:hypothetical protein
MQSAILISGVTIAFCWAVAVLLLRWWLMPKAPRPPEIESQV